MEAPARETTGNKDALRMLEEGLLHQKEKKDDGEEEDYRRCDIKKELFVFIGVTAACFVISFPLFGSLWIGLHTAIEVNMMWQVKRLVWMAVRWAKPEAHVWYANTASTVMYLACIAPVHVLYVMYVLMPQMRS